jgi:hypothetical protein
MSNGSNVSRLKKNETEESVNESSGQTLSGSDRERQIAEAAYYRAEKRGFEQGLDLDDWLAAEEEISATSTNC